MRAAWGAHTETDDDSPPGTALCLAAAAGNLAAGRDLRHTHVTTGQSGCGMGPPLACGHRVPARQRSTGRRRHALRDRPGTRRTPACSASSWPLRRARPPGRARAAPPAYLIHPAARRRHRGLGQPAGHRGQRPRAHPGQRGGAVRRRGRGILTDLGDRRGAGLPRHRRWRRPRRSCYRADAAAGRLPWPPPGRPATWTERPEGTSAAAADRPPRT